MARVKRIDIGMLSKPEFRADGTVVVEARLARTGVYSYPDSTYPNGIRKEFRPDTAVFDSNSLQSFVGRPVTNEHPLAMLTADNAKQFAVGAVLDKPRRDGKYMVAKLSIFDAATIAEMKAGKTQVSNGYDADLIMESGISPDGEHFDCIQSNIEGNHVAIVHNARAGKDAAVRMDAAAVEINLASEEIMDLAQALAELAKTQKELGAVIARADAAEKEIVAAKKVADLASARADSAEELLKKEKQAHKDALDAAPLKIKARIELEHTASKVLGKEFKCDGLSDRDIQVKYIKHVTDADVPASKSDDYVAARFDAALEQASASAEVFVKANDVIQAHRDADNEPHRASAAKTEMVKKQHTFIAPTK